MHIQPIYDRYSIPLHLQTHMRNVAGVGYAITTHWSTGVQGNQRHMLDKRVIVETLLVHDMGNIVKFDFKHNFFTPVNEIPYWKKVQADFIKKFGTDEHTATTAVAKECGMRKEVVHYLEIMGDLTIALATLSHDWNFKIMFYADFRVGPNGVVSLDERVNDLLTRYKNRKGFYWSSKKNANKLLSVVKKIENELQPFVSFDLQELASYVSPYDI